MVPQTRHRKKPIAPKETTAVTPTSQALTGKTWLFVGGLVLVAGIVIALLKSDASAGSTPRIGYRVINEYPHDSNAYTQGLLLEEGQLYESTGRYGESSVRIVDLETGKVKKQTMLAGNMFGEGLALWNDQLIQLTWEENTIFTYSKNKLLQLSSAHYDGEGWGLTHDGQQLILSDGSSTLRMLDPKTLKPTGMLEVRLNNRRVRDINELEYVDGFIYANIWHTDLIYKISPKSGEVKAIIDLSNLFDTSTLTDDQAVLNGIAHYYTKDKKLRLLVTGKLWPKLFEIELVELE